MNKTTWLSFLTETEVPPQMSRVEKQKAALRLKLARQKFDSSQASSSEKPLVNQTLIDNFQLIYRHISSGGRKERRAESQRTLTNVYAAKLLEKTPLSEIKLNKFLGAGVFSAAFEDDSGHVVKCGIIRDKTSEESFYQQYLSNPSKEFVVFYFKAIPIPDKENEKLYIAITNKFLTFFEYCQFHQGTNMIPNLAWPEKYGELFGRFRNEDKWNFGKLFIVREYMNREKAKLSPRNFLLYWNKIEGGNPTKDIGDFKKELQNIFGISNKDSTKIFEQILDVFCKQKIPDVHLKNLGVNITSGMDNPNFFFFDR